MKKDRHFAFRQAKRAEEAALEGEGEGWNSRDWFKAGRRFGQSQGQPLEMGWK